MLKRIENIKLKIDEDPCLHCVHNPKAIEPFKKMHSIDLTPLTEALLTKYSEKIGISTSCIICFAIKTICQSDVDFQEFVEGRK
jgi:hypothetical protein